MAGAFTHKDGRLKTGRVTALVFMGLLGVFALLFKINSSVDHALLVVKHVFEPEKIEPIKEKPAIRQNIVQIPSAKDKALAQKKTPLPDGTKTEAKKSVDPVGNEKAETAVREKPPADSATVKSAVHKEEDPLPVKAAQANEKKTVSTESLVGDSENKEMKPDPPNREITVAQREYKALFHSWQMAGKKGKGDQKPPLRVENLRNTFDLFQMKPVAVIRGKTFFDLTDGTRVAEKALAEYSTTVFLVDRPWDKWGKALAAAGIRQGDQFEVRYYMYDFIKDAIYSRANQAFSWCRERGLVPADIPASATDILGRAYVINRQGGGRFGVFVPVSLNTKDGRSVVVDPACFRGQADVDALRKAGVL